MSLLTKENITKAISDAGYAHHEYEQTILGGKRDQYWSGFYAAYVLGRFGGFVKPSTLTHWLEEIPVGENWITKSAI